MQVDAKQQSQVSARSAGGQTDRVNIRVLEALATAASGGRAGIVREMLQRIAAEPTQRGLGSGGGIKVLDDSNTGRGVSERLQVSTTGKRWSKIRWALGESRRLSKRTAERATSDRAADAAALGTLAGANDGMREKPVVSERRRRVLCNVVMQSKALWRAARGGHEEVCAVLLESGYAMVDAPGTGDSSPLWVAASHGFARTVTLMLSYGADVNRPDECGCTPLQIATSLGHAAVARVLEKAGGAMGDDGANKQTEAGEATPRWLAPFDICALRYHHNRGVSAPVLGRGGSARGTDGESGSQPGTMLQGDADVDADSISSSGGGGDKRVSAAKTFVRQASDQSDYRSTGSAASGRNSVISTRSSIFSVSGDNKESEVRDTMPEMASTLPSSDLSSAKSTRAMHQTSRKAAYMRLSSEIQQTDLVSAGIDVEMHMTEKKGQRDKASREEEGGEDKGSQDANFVWHSDESPIERRSSSSLTVSSRQSAYARCVQPSSIDDYAAAQHDGLMHAMSLDSI